MERKVKAKVKKIIAEVEKTVEYIAHSTCPFCNYRNEANIEEDNITMIQTCYMCREKYKVKIPKDTI